jgi:hypothetical protein
MTDSESLTVLVVSGATRDEVAAALSVDLSAPAALDEWVDEGVVDKTGWAIIEVSGGVLAIEPSGYGDPTNSALAAMSGGGRSAAVARSNIQAHERFGCARDGQLAFDDDEFNYLEDPSGVPDELRPLFDLAWDDLEDDEPGGELSGVIVALAMCEAWTGVPITAGDFVSARESGWCSGPALVYVRD